MTGRTEVRPHESRLQSVVCSPIRYIPPVSLTALFAPTFRDRAGDVALEWACQEHTFGDLDGRANRMAGALAARGLTYGDRLAIQLPNRIEYLALFLAATRLGVIPVPINVLY